MTVDGHGAQVAADVNDVRSQETYIGYARADTFASKGGIKRDTEHSYAEPAHVQLNEWGAFKAAGGKIIFRFHARDLHLVLGPGTQGRSIRYRVTIDARLQGRLTVSIPMHKARES